MELEILYSRMAQKGVQLLRLFFIFYNNFISHLQLVPILAQHKTCWF